MLIFFDLFNILLNKGKIIVLIVIESIIVLLGRKVVLMSKGTLFIFFLIVLQLLFASSQLRFKTKFEINLI